MSRWLRASLVSALVMTTATISSCAHAPPPPDAVLVVRAPRGSQLLIDDVCAGLALGEPTPIQSGSHRVEVRAEGRLCAYRDLAVLPGQRATLEVTLRPDLDGADAP